jgi:DNA-binding winged helix-turn-helix (wHTH) protein/Tol biopolymer transport system component
LIFWLKVSIVQYGSIIYNPAQKLFDGGVPMRSQVNRSVYRFGPFELEASTGVLRKNGRPIKLPPQPAKVLFLLVARPDKVISREEVHRQIWGDQTFVDFEHALNVCIRQLRETLNDDAKTPRYIETIPRLGYRFIAPVDKTYLANLDGDVEQTAAVAVREASGQRLALARRARLLKLLFQLSVACLLLIGAFTAGYVRGKRRPGSAPPSFHRLTFERGIIYSARFAPDNQVVYDASWDNKPIRIFTTRAGLPQPMPLDFASAHLLGISVTGELALTLNGYPQTFPVFLRGTLARAPMAGGAPRLLLEDVRWADWDRIGELAVVHHFNGRSHLEYPVGKVLHETAGWISHIRFSPRSVRIAFVDHPILGDDRGTIVVVDLNSQEKKVLSTGWESAMGLAWSARGDEIWFTAAKAGERRDLFAVDLHGRQRTLLQIPGGVTLQDTSPDGRVLLTEDNEREGVIALTPAGERDLSWSDISFPRGISPDGKKVILNQQSEEAGSDYLVGLRSIDGSPPVRLGEGGGTNFSPDGKWTATNIGSMPESTFLLPIGAGERKELRHPGIRSIAATWLMADGKSVVFAGIEAGHLPRTYIQSLQGGLARPITPEGLLGRNPSPDGRYLVVQQPDQSQGIYDIQRGESRAIVGATGQLWPAGWSPDSRDLYMYTKTRPPSQIWRFEIGNAQKKLVKQLSPPDPAGILEISPVQMTPDAKTFVYGYDRYLSELYIVDGLH